MGPFLDVVFYLLLLASSVIVLVKAAHVAPSLALMPVPKDFRNTLGRQCIHMCSQSFNLGDTDTRVRIKHSKRLDSNYVHDLVIRSM